MRGSAPPGVSGLSLISVETNSSNSVKVTILWKRPSDRNGHFKYQLNFVGKQPGIYSNSTATVIQQSVELNSTEEIYAFSGLPGAQCLVQISAINYKTGLSSPETTINGTTVSIRK